MRRRTVALFRRMKQATSGKGLHRLFELAIFFKGVDGLLETAGGLLILFVPLHSLDTWVRWLVAHELIGSHDFLADAAEHLLDSVSLDSKRFASVYLIGHGLIKIFLVYALWREKLWAFPAALWFIALFVVYQLYRFTHTYSIALLIFALLDVLVAWFIWREYLVRKAGLRPAR
jgi:uncharacterized membrane protein